MLLVLFLGVADFGRVFQAGIVVEAAARNAAEAVAGDLRLKELTSATCDAACQTQIYSDLQVKAADAACDDAQRLFATTDGGGACAGLLVVGSCVLDDIAGHACGVPAGELIPPGCDQLSEPWSTVNISPEGAAAGAPSTKLRNVEVRLCYRFQPFYRALELPMVSHLVPDVYIEKARTFVVSSDY